MTNVQTSPSDFLRSLRARIAGQRLRTRGIRSEWVFFDPNAGRTQGADPGQGRILGRYIDARTQKIVFVTGQGRG